LKKYIGIVLVLFVFVLLWHIVSVLVSRPIMPAPIAVTSRLISFAVEGRLWGHVWISIIRIFLALALAGIPAVILGLAAGRSNRLNLLISPIIYVLHPLPKAAFIPAIFLFFGIGEFSRIFLIAFIIFTHMLVTIRDSVKQVPAEYLEAVRSLGAGRLTLLREVIIPAALPGFFTSLRISLGVAVAVLFIAETFISVNGLGHLVLDAWLRISYVEMYAAIMAMSLLGLVLFFLTDLLEYLLCPWRRTSS